MSAAVITLETPVDEVVLRLPGALPVLAACGIDTCCGGALPLGEAARRHALDPEKLLARLRREKAAQPVAQVPEAGGSSGDLPTTR